MPSPKGKGIQYYSQYPVHCGELGIYDTISDSISIRDIILELYDTISDSISVRDTLLDSYDKISDAQPEGQGHSIMFAISCSPSVNWKYMIRYQMPSPKGKGIQ